MQEIKQKLNKVLSALDDIMNDPELEILYWKVSECLRPYELLKGSKGKLVKYNAEIITNAWLKMYELCNLLNPVMEKSQKSIIKSFHLAEAPGNFILAINHWINNHHPRLNWDWKANSYIERYSSESNYLSDEYHLIERYSDNWVWGADGDGDITSINNIRSFSNLSVDFTTGDAKYITANINWNEEENMNTPVIFGQFLSSLWCLKKGGTMIIKLFTFLESPMICLLALASYCFDNLYIVKPLTSRPSNKEVYLTGIGYKNNISNMKKKYLLEYMDFIRPLNTGDPLPPLFTSVSNKFISSLIEIASQLSGNQIEAFEKNMRLLDQVQSSNFESVKLSLSEFDESKSDEWIETQGIKYLAEDLKMVI